MTSGVRVHLVKSEENAYKLGTSGWEKIRGSLTLGLSTLFFLLFQNSSSKSDSMYTDMLVIESKYIRTMLLKC